MTGEPSPQFRRVLEEAVALQHQLPWLEMVVGGAAAALHARHRDSDDTDHVTHFLREEFDVVAKTLEEWEGWKTNRLNRPVAILGERHNVQMGVRQSSRTVPYEVMQVEGLRIPTPAEALRIKAYLLSERKATRAFLDVAALADVLGNEAAVEALSYLNLLYVPVGNQTRLTKFAEVCHQEPLDLERVDLRSYKGITPPYDDWGHVSERCKEMARLVLLREMEDALPVTLDRFPPVSGEQQVDDDTASDHSDNGGIEE